MLLLQIGLHANSQPRGCVMDLFCNYLIAVNSSWHSYLTQEAKKNHIVSFGSYFFIFLHLPFFWLPGFCPLCDAGDRRWTLYHPHGTAVASSGWVHIRNLRHIPSSTDPKHTNVFTPHCSKETTTILQMGLLPPSQEHKYLILFPGASGFLISCSI